MQNVVRHPSLYFDDGNIVLSALSTANSELSRTIKLNNATDASDPTIPSTILFRVHKSLLSKSSVVFRDMLELGEGSPDVGEKYDGASMVQMPDSAEEVEDILKFFYEPWGAQLRRYHPDTCLRVKNALAMATKYQFSGVRRDIVTHIENDWPKTLDEWDGFEDYLSSLRTQRISEYSYGPEPAATAMLATQFNIPQVLPAVFYCLSKINTSDDWITPEVTDPRKLVEIVKRNSSALDLTPGRARVERRARWDLLERDQLRNLLKGRDLMERFVHRQLELMDFDSYCAKSGPCREDRKELKGYVYEAEHPRDPLNALRIDNEAWEFTPNICYKCKSKLRKLMEKTRKELWEKLPIFFEISKLLPSQS